MAFEADAPGGALRSLGRMRVASKLVIFHAPEGRCWKTWV